MNHLRNFVRNVLVLAACQSVLLLYFTKTSVAQPSVHWHRIYTVTLSSEMTNGHFFNRDYGVIAGNHSLRGTNNILLRTVNAGSTWQNPTFQNTSILQYDIFSTVFPDSLRGWISLADPQLDTIRNGVWQTSDGGQSWRVQGDSAKVLQLDLSPSGRLLSSQGQIAFQDSLNGIACILSPSNLNPRGFRAASSTTDGGITWSPLPALSNEYGEWSIRYQPISHTYIMSTSQSDFSSGYATSSDFGSTWQMIGTLNAQNCGSGQSGGSDDLAVINNMTITQSCGLDRSTDGGASWTHIDGPFGAFNDTRILLPKPCNGAVIVSFGGFRNGQADTTGGVYMTTDGGDGSIPLPGDTLTILPPKFDSVFACDTTRLPLFFANCGCTPADYHFDSVVVSNDALGQFSIQNRKLFPKQWDGFASRDTLWVSYAPNFRLGASNAVIHLYGRIIRDSTVAPFDSLIPVSAFARSEALSVLANLDSLNLGKINLCTAGKDSVVRITNRTCSSVTLDSSWIVGSGFNLSPLTLPFVLAHDSSIILHIHILPTSSGVDTEWIHLRATFGTEHEIISVKLSASGVRVSSVLTASHSAVRFALEPLCGRDSITVGLHTPGCDSLRLDSVVYSGDADFGAAPVSGFVTLTDSGVAKIYFHPASPGSHNGTVTIYSHDLVDGSTHDTTISITGSVQPPGVELAALASQIPPLSYCAEDSTIITVENVSCDTITFDPAQVNGLGYSVSTSDPVVVRPGGLMHYRVKLSPAGKGMQNGAVQITAHDVHNGVPVQDTVLRYSTEVLDGAKTLSIDSSIRNLGTGSVCRLADTMIIFKNTGCDSLTIKSVAANGQNFTLRSTNAPTKLAPGASDTLLVQYVPTVTGSDSATIILKTNADQDSIVNIPFTAESIAPQALTLQTALSRTNIPTGDTTTLFVTPSKTITAAGLTTLSCSIAYDGDLLTYIPNSILVASGFTGANPIETRSGKTSTLKLTLNATGNPTTFTKASTLASVRFRTTLTDSLATPITLGNLILNNGDSLFNKCTLSLNDSNTNFTLALNCGDPTINAALRDKLAFEIQSITPNPTTGMLTVTVANNTSAAIHYEVFDALGHTAQQGTFNAATNILDMQSLPSGSYYLRLVSRERVESRRIILAR